MYDLVDVLEKQKKKKALKSRLDTLKIINELKKTSYLKDCDKWHQVATTYYQYLKDEASFLEQPVELYKNNLKYSFEKQGKEFLIKISKTHFNDTKLVFELTSFINEADELARTIISKEYFCKEEDIVTDLMHQLIENQDIIKKEISEFVCRILSNELFLKTRELSKWEYERNYLRKQLCL